jgi:hypothetical protein
MQLTTRQQELVDLPLSGSVYLHGPAGAGKTTAAIARLSSMLRAGVPGDEILILVPQRTLGTPYLKALQRELVLPGRIVSILTAGGLAQRMVELFWPVLAKPAGFLHPETLPTFLTLETAQYVMAGIVAPLIEQGLFDSVVMDRNRLYSQIIDNLNKAAIVGFPYTEIGERLKGAWVGKPGQLRVYDDAQTCATLFRQYCLEHTLLDFSLQVEVFWKIAWKLELCHAYLVNSIHHIIADNIEEDTPFSHNLLAEWMPKLDSCLLVSDWQAGFRRFLGADPESAVMLGDLCETNISFPDSMIASPSIQALRVHFEHTLQNHPPPPPPADPRPALVFQPTRYFPQMLDWVASTVAELVHDQATPPSEIVILSPFMSDALRYSLINRLESLSVPVHSHRPSRSLREDPVTHVWLTLAKLAHPHWELPITRFDLASACLQTIEGLDLIRSHILAQIVFRPSEKTNPLGSFDQIIPDTQSRITYVAGERYERLRNWILSYQSHPSLELDHFIAALFGEVLSQPGYRFHSSWDAGSVTARLIESIRKFRRVAGPLLAAKDIPVSKEYITMIESGVIAAQYLESWESKSQPAVLIAPAYTFLISNYPVDIQFWLDVASYSWSDRLSQPLTHPYVLSRYWPRDKVWTDDDELETSQDTLFRLVNGLLNRCRQRIYLGLTDLGEQGYEQRGLLLRMINRILQNYVTQ